MIINISHEKKCDIYWRLRTRRNRRGEKRGRDSRKVSKEERLNRLVNQTTIVRSLEDQGRLLIRSLHSPFLFETKFRSSSNERDFTLSSYNLFSVSHSGSLLLVKVRIGANSSPLTGNQIASVGTTNCSIALYERMPTLVWLIYRRSFWGLNSSKSFLPHHPPPLHPTGKGHCDLIAKAGYHTLQIE